MLHTTIGVISVIEFSLLSVDTVSISALTPRKGQQTGSNQHGEASFEFHDGLFLTAPLPLIGKCCQSDGRLGVSGIKVNHRYPVQQVRRDLFGENIWHRESSTRTTTSISRSRLPYTSDSNVPTAVFQNAGGIWYT